MSSHHIVRENQEPALLVEHFHALSEEYLGQLLEWSPTVITTSDMVDYFLTKDIKVDILYGDETAIAQEDIKRITTVESFWIDTLTFLVENNYKAVNIMAKKLHEDFLLFAAKINIVVFVDGVKYVLVRNKFEKWKTVGQKMFMDSSKIKSFNGLRYIGDNIFEVEQDGFVMFEMNTDCFVFLGEEI